MLLIVVLALIVVLVAVVAAISGLGPRRDLKESRLARPLPRPLALVDRPPAVDVPVVADTMGVGVGRGRDCVDVLEGGARMAADGDCPQTP